MHQLPPPQPRRRSSGIPRTRTPTPISLCTHLLIHHLRAVIPVLALALAAVALALAGLEVGVLLVLAVTPRADACHACARGRGR